MRYWAFIVLVSMLFFLSSVRAEKSNRMIVEADVLAPVVRVEVPDFVSFGSVTQGFSSERVKIVLNNTGTTAIEVTPRLDGPDAVFSHLVFARRTTEDFVPIGSFHMTVPRPRIPGKSEDDYLYAKLDLTQFSGKANEDLNHHRA